MGNKEIGDLGEQLAEQFLKKQKYRIIGRNIRSPFGEIDIIAEHRKTIVFIEVKTRRNAEFGFPEESVTENKRKKLGKLASWYLTTHRKFKTACRFDVLAIELTGAKPEFRLIQNAFEYEE